MPGSVVTNSSALRLPVGSFRIWFVSMVDVTAGDCVWMISEPALDDDGLFQTADFERDLHRAGVPALTRTSLRTAVLKPMSVTVTV